MRSSMLVPAVVLFVGIGVAFADVKAPATDTKGQDTSMSAKCAMAQKACPQMGERSGRMERGPWAGRDRMGMGFPGFARMNGEWRHGPMMAGMNPGHIMMVRKAVHVFFLAILIVNILLTILVSLDMTKRARFNGLWIPILLIAGIPGSGIYALFRIGDSIAEAKRV